MKYTSVQDRDNVENEMPWADCDVPKTMHDYICNAAKKWGPRPAISFQITSGPKDKAQTLTWQDYCDRSIQAANLFRALGVQETDTVAYLLPICNEAAVTLVGGAIAGIANPVNPLLGVDQIAAILRESKAKVLVTMRSFPKSDLAQKSAAAVKLAPNITHILEVDLLHYLSPPKSWIVPLIRPKVNHDHHAKVMDFGAEVAKQNTKLDFPDASGNRIGAYFHTGGTTGMPKLAQHTYEGIVYNGWLGSRMLFDETDTIICPLPLFHVFGCHVILSAMISSGAHMVLPTPQGYRGEGVFDNFWKLIERWDVTFMITVPTAISALMQRPVDADVSSLKTAFSGSAPLPVELINRFERATGVTVVEGYGLTEATCLVSVNPASENRKIGSVGLPLPHTKVRILNISADGKTATDCATDEVGEICVSNPGVLVGKTYTEAAKNADLFADTDYLRTGDLGRLDNDGYLFITGRAKDLIIRGGHNIDPGEIEETLAGHPAVAFAGAIGQPDAHSGEVPIAFVELVADAETTPAELVAYCKKNIGERAAQPKYIEILDELPKTAVGKVFKPDLRKSAITRVFNEALANAGTEARIEAVLEDKKRGLVAQVSGGGENDDAIIKGALSAFARPFDRV